MKLRIVKYDERNYGIERKGIMGWSCIHSTPGYQTEDAAIDGLKRYVTPEVVYTHDGYENERV